jgi:hypothetical protein
LEEIPSLNSLQLDITPLQIAVSYHDYQGICTLLKHGADPNEVGIMGGKKVPILSTALGRISPLRIFRSIPSKSFISQRQEIRDRIEFCLIQYGGKDFEVDETGNHIATRTEPPVSPLPWEFSPYDDGSADETTSCGSILEMEEDAC